MTILVFDSQWSGKKYKHAYSEEDSLQTSTIIKGSKPQSEESPSRHCSPELNQCLEWN